MGKASKTKQEFGRREKIAAQRAAAKRAEQRRNGLLIAGGAVIVVIAIVVVFIVVKTNKSPSTPSAGASISGAPAGTNLSSVISTATSVPTSATDAAGSGGSAVTAPKTISGTALTNGGKPDMLYIGAEYCPYCAAERWSMIVALSRFGTFSGLQPMRSSSTDVYPNTATWTFAHSKYTSKYVSFSPVEIYSNIPTSGGGYTALQTPTAAQNDLFKKYSDQESFPFVDFGNKYVINGSSYNPQVLASLSWNQIASDLTNASSPVAQGVNATANYMTAALCALTNNQPATACTSTVQGLESKI
jgi:hypothetical protein